MAASEQPRLPTPQLRVLLVEDEIMIALLLEEMLAELDFEVVGPVARLDRAVEMAQRQALDVALLDVNLNGKEIYPVAEALAAREVPFVFVTGYGRGLCARRIATAQPCGSRSAGTTCASYSQRFAARNRPDLANPDRF
jgi:CheY-like chemotaxis protein